MAGIGFELRKVLKKESLLSLATMYGYSAVLSSGPWVISIIAVLVVGIVDLATVRHAHDIYTLQIVVTYGFALASTLIVTGTLQLPLTRYVADLTYADRTDEVIGTYLGVLFVVVGVSFGIFVPLVWAAFGELSVVEKLMTASVFVILCAVWISNILVASLKYYRRTLAAYAASYGLIVVTSYLWGDTLAKLLFFFFAGNALLLTLMMLLVYKSYHGDRILRFGFFNRRSFYYSLAAAGLFYNLGIWIDKFIFWYHPMTGEAVVGLVHRSVVYDLPVFLSYLSIIPGMAVFFYRLEADFADAYDHFYDNVRFGGTLQVIRAYRNQMVDTVRLAIKEAFAVQVLVMLVLYLTAPQIFEALKIPKLYLGLFYVLNVGATLQLGVMVIMAILFYLDRRIKAMALSVFFFVLNALLSWLSIYLGPEYFGYGYTVSLLIVFTVALIVIRQTMERLDYETFMYQ